METITYVEILSNASYTPGVVYDTLSNLTSTTTTEPTVTPYAASSMTPRLAEPGSQELIAIIVNVKRYIGFPLLVLGMLSNVLTLLTLRQPNLKETPYSRLTALAVADLAGLVLIFIDEVFASTASPTSYYRLFYSAYVFYPLVNVFTTFGIWVVVLMTVERCIMLQFPLHAPIYSSARVSRIYISVVVFFAILINLPRFAWFYVASVPQTFTSTTIRPQSAVNGGTLIMNSTPSVLVNFTETITTTTNATTESSSSSTKYRIVHNLYDSEFSKVVAWIHSVLIQLLPMIMLIIFNAFLIYKVRSQRRQQSQLGVHKSLRSVWSREQRKLTLTLIAIVCLFVVLVSPSAFSDNHIVVLLFPPKSEAILIFQHLTNFLAWANMSVNFLLYTFINSKFKHAFRNMLRDWRKAIKDNLFCWGRRERAKQFRSSGSSHSQSIFQMVATERLLVRSCNSSNNNDTREEKVNMSTMTKENSFTLSFRMDTEDDKC